MQERIYRDALHNVIFKRQIKKKAGSGYEETVRKISET